MGPTGAIAVVIRFRDLEPEDLPDLDWSGGPLHLRAVAQYWQDSLTGAAEILVGAADNGRLVAMGAVDFHRDPDAGRLHTLAVHELLQSTGIGSALVAALEDRVRGRDRPYARLSVELDNPRARRLYERLGYRSLGPITERWPSEAGGMRTAACLEMERHLGVGGARDDPVGGAH